MRHPWTLAVLVGSLVIVLLGLLGWAVVGRSVAWVHAQSVYSTTFRELMLEPEPPPWYRGGREGFLDRCSRGDLNPGPFSVLGFDKNELETLIKRNPVVKRVKKIRVQHPNKVVVQLDYREPVAVAEFDDAPGLILDAEAVILPPDVVTPDGLTPLIPLSRFPAPADPRPGEAWGQDQTNPIRGPEEPRRRIAVAAQLAFSLRPATLIDTQTSDRVGIVSKFLRIHGSPDHPLYVQVGKSTMLQWSGYRTDEPSEDVKRAMFLEWLRSRSWTANQGTDYWKFTREGIVPAPTKRSQSPLPPG